MPRIIPNLGSTRSGGGRGLLHVDLPELRTRDVAELERAAAPRRRGPTTA